MEIDKLNLLETTTVRSEPYYEYFSEMGITEEQVDARIDFANDFEEFLALIMTLVIMQRALDAQDYGFVRQQIVTGYKNVIEVHIGNDERTDKYVEKYADDFVDATLRNSDDAWFFSLDRVMWNAENEAVTMLGYSDIRDAVEAGYTHKTWNAFIDKHTRKTHASLNGHTIPILNYFDVGGAKAFFPKDTVMPESTLMSYPEQLVNCRCFLTFS